MPVLISYIEYSYETNFGIISSDIEDEDSCAVLSYGETFD